MHSTTGHRNSVHRHAGNQADANVVLHGHEFAQFRDMIYSIAGITMSPAKKQPISNRLAKRLKHYSPS